MKQSNSVHTHIQKQKKTKVSEPNLEPQRSPPRRSGLGRHGQLTNPSAASHLSLPPASSPPELPGGSPLVGKDGGGGELPPSFFHPRRALEAGRGVLMAGGSGEGYCRGVCRSGTALS